MLHRSQVFLLIMLAFISGIFLGSFVSVDQKYVWIAIAICAAAVAVFFRRDSKLLRPKVAFYAFLALIFLFGFSRINTTNSEKHLLQEFAKAAANIKDPSGKHKVKIDLIGYINNEPSRGAKMQSFVFKSKELISGNYSADTDESVLVNTDFFPEYKYGQKLEIYGELQLPSSTASPHTQNLSVGASSSMDPVRGKTPSQVSADTPSAGRASNGVDYAAYLAKDDIFTTMYQPMIRQVDFNFSFFEKYKVAILQKIFTFKSAFETAVSKAIPEPNAAFVNGILLGSRAQIPDALKNDFAITSTTHILAISGFNITIVAGILASFFLFFFKRRTAFWFAIAGIALFTILTGAQASVIRAAIMGCLFLLATRVGRPYTARNAVIFAGALMVLLSPEILRYDVGFQLSFMATLGLIYLCPFFTDKFKKITNFFGLRENLAMTLSAQIAVLPLLIFYFNRLSIVSLPTNLLVLPMVPLAMLLGFVAGLAGMILPFLGVIIGYFAWFLTAIQLWLVEFFAKPSWAAPAVAFPWYALAITYVVMIFVIYKWIYARPKPKQK
ncbi:MAG: ComEC/Rec2 family competence protein [Minisyncoccia bacterium]